MDDFEIVIADQSSNNDTLNALQRYSDDQRVHRVPVSGVGMARARNVAISACRASYVAITDDDCVVDRQWLERIQEAFDEESSVGILFGTVRAGPFDCEEGFIPTYIRDRRILLRDVREKNEADGIGACMAIRRELWEQLYGFDESLGSGGVLRAGSEGDLTFRAMLRGWHVLENPEIIVTHNGFRTWEQSRDLAMRYWYGAGAMHAKFVRIRWFTGTRLFLSLGYRWVFSSSRVASSFGTQSLWWVQLRAFLSGFGTGMISPIDRQRQHYKISGNGDPDNSSAQ